MLDKKKLQLLGIERRNVSLSNFISLQLLSKKKILLPKSFSMFLFVYLCGLGGGLVRQGPPPGSDPVFPA